MKNIKSTSLCLLATIACVDEAELASLEGDDVGTGDSGSTGEDAGFEAEAAEIDDSSDDGAPDPQSLPYPPACDYGSFNFGATCAIATSKTRITYVPVGNGCYQQVIEYLVNWYNLDYYFNGRIRHGTPYASEWTTNPVTHSYCSTACYDNGLY
jgi:hypothetical protein